MNVTIRSKLIGGFTIILVLLIFMSFFMISKYFESNDRLKTIVEVYSKKINLSNELMIAVLQAGKYEKNIIIEKDPIQKDVYKNKIYQQLDIIDKKTLELQELVDGKGIQVLDEFKTNWTSYKTDLRDIISLAMKNENEEAFEISITRGLKTRDEAVNQLEWLITKNETSMEDAKIENNASYNSALSLIIALIIVSILLAIIISYWIIQSITKRISGIAKEAEKIASREFTNDKLEDATNDELKPLFNSLVNVN